MNPSGQKWDAVMIFFMNLDYSELLEYLVLQLELKKKKKENPVLNNKVDTFKKIVWEKK